MNDIELLKFLWLGFLLGLRHALDADHLVAVTAMTAETKKIRSSAYIGMMWGVGHSVVLIVAASLLVFFEVRLSGQVGKIAEILVGFVIIILGMRIMIKARANKIHLHAHTHDGKKHVHLHSHADHIDHSHAHLKRPLLVGMLHGFAGSGALLLFIIASGASSHAVLGYALFFGLGTIIAMALLSPLIGMPFLFAKRFGSSALTDFFRYVAGSFSIVFGIIWILQKL